MEVGSFFEQQKVVTIADTALSMGSGTLEVFATPAMVAFAENTAMKAIEHSILENETSVGIAIDVKHVRASAVGENVSCKAKIVALDGRKIDFDIIVIDSGNNIIGELKHSRVVVDIDRFMNKLKQ